MTEEMILTPMCELVQRDGSIWLLAMYWGELAEGHVKGEVLRQFDASKVNAKQLGAEVKKGFKKYRIVPADEAGPADPFELLSNGKRSKFVKGSMAVFVLWDPVDKTLTVQGSFAPTGAGHVNYKSLKPLPDKTSDSALGEVILAEFERIRKKEKL